MVCLTNYKVKFASSIDEYGNCWNRTSISIQTICFQLLLKLNPLTVVLASYLFFKPYMILTWYVSHISLLQPNFFGLHISYLESTTYIICQDCKTASGSLIASVPPPAEIVFGWMTVGLCLLHSKGHNGIVEHKVDCALKVMGLKEQIGHRVAKVLRIVAWGLHVGTTNNPPASTGGQLASRRLPEIAHLEVLHDLLVGPQWSYMRMNRCPSRPNQNIACKSPPVQWQQKIRFLQKLSNGKWLGPCRLSMFWFCLQSTHSMLTCLSRVNIMFTVNHSFCPANMFGSL